MKKLYNPLPAGGAPLYTETLDDALQVEIWDALEGILSDVDPELAYPKAVRDFGAPLQGGFIINGGAVTDNTTTWDIADGIVYFVGTKQFARFIGQTGILPTEVALIQLDSPVVTQKTFFDATLKNYYETYTASVTKQSTATLVPAGAIVVRQLEALGNLPNTLMGHPTFGNFLNEINIWTLDNGKQTITPLNAWIDGGCFYRKLGGTVHVGLAVTNSAGATNDIVFQLPADYRPAVAETATGIAVATTSGNSYPITVVSTGDVSIVGASGQAEGGIYAQFSFLESNFNS